MQRFDVATNYHKNILQNVVSIQRSHDTQNEAPERWLQTAKQVFKRLAVITLCSKYPLGFLS
jgi:hypothetical protein